MNNHALIVDDEPDILELLQLTLGQMEIEARGATNLSQARALLDQFHFDLCLTDMRLPDGTGLELVQYIQKHHTSLPVAVITAYGNMQVAIDALKAGAFDFVAKPVKLEALRKLVRHAIKLGQCPQHDHPEDKQLLGESDAICQIHSMIRKLSRSQAPVHISGESGTGKELAARLIHENSTRYDKPLITVNCGAIPFELMESELFGHKKGSFTGADRDKKGLFEAADNSTILLDEVAELPMSMQVKLLRVIQEHKIRPVGELDEKHIDVRILSATNKNLYELVAENEFRHDLYFRLNVIELHLPALRERGDDVLLLAEQILKNTDSAIQLDQSARNALLGYPFPGNIRELENILERAVTLNEGSVIHAADLLLPDNNPGTPPTRQPKSQLRGNKSLDEFLTAIEHDEIKSALNVCNQNHTRAAQVLGISPRQLRYRISKLDLSDDQ